MSLARNARIKKELQSFRENPPLGISYWPEDSNFKQLKAVIFGDEDSVYKGGVFKLEIDIPERYPFQPPKVHFTTKIYHPNIDSMGRICLDVLKMPPSGSWRPAHNIASILTSVRLLMSAPNSDDPLMIDIAEEMKINPSSFETNAREWTKKYASDRKMDNN